MGIEFPIAPGAEQAKASGVKGDLEMGTAGGYRKFGQKAQVWPKPGS